MADKPVYIFVGRKELVGYTSMTLSRSKEELTGSLTVELFMGWMPNEAVLDSVVRGEEILVYVGRQLAFRGNIDRRKDKGNTSENGTRGNFGVDSYTVTITARGKTKNLVDSSHQHAEGTLLETTNQNVFEELLEPFNIQLEWLATVVDLHRVRLRDTSRVVDELQRIAQQTGCYFHETRDGIIRVTDGPTNNVGEDIVLGTNILSFSTDQIGDAERSRVITQGQLTAKDKWGAEAVIDTIKRVVDESVPYLSPIGIQCFGDGTPDTLERRTQYETNKRTKKAKQVSLEVFHVQQTSGEPWDIGDQHYVEIPPAGIFAQMEVTSLTYNVKADGSLTTSLTLTPQNVQTSVSSSVSVNSILGSLPLLDTTTAIAASRIANFNVGQLINSWASSVLSDFVEEVEDTVVELLADVSQDAVAPPLQLPSSFKGAEDG